MNEPWKVIVCSAEQCMSETLDEDGEVKEGYHLTPRLDTPEVTEFVCPRCGQVETWGPTRRRIAQVLWEKAHGSSSTL